MSTATIQKLKKEIKKELLEEFILPILEQAKDLEGEYREEFVKEILKAAKEKPRYKYSSKNFLKLAA
ncbi:MAG: hypothetical protein HYT03_01865 [Candidatus Harrisonbacteria bacterium]|nr:hypothetical protein [Candidatus Harrisonbacteria bacterium]